MATAAKLGLTTFSTTPNVFLSATSPLTEADHPLNFKESDLRLIFKEDRFFLYWDSEFARIGCRTTFHAEIPANYSDPICKSWDRAFARARGSRDSFKDPERAAEKLRSIREMFAEYRVELRSIQLSLRGYLQTLEKSSEDLKGKLEMKDVERYRLITRMLPCLDRRFRDLHRLANGILLGDVETLHKSCCAAIRKASSCLYGLTREAGFDAGSARRGASLRR